MSNTVVDHIVYTGGSPRFNILKFDSSLLQYLGLGLEYITAKKTISPILTFAVHNIISPQEWEDMLFDAYFYIRPNIEFDLQNVRVANFEARAKLWFYFPDSGFGGTEKNGGYLMARGGIFCAFSMIQTDPNDVDYEGGRGLGFEIGAGFAVLDNLNMGMKPDFFNISYFWNYSEYFETYPEMSQGFRFLLYI